MKERRFIYFNERKNVIPFKIKETNVTKML